MKRLKRSSGLLVFCVLLLGTLAGAVSASPGAQLTVTAKKLTVLGADCYPWSDDADYLNDGTYIRAKSGLVSFVCPVTFPEYATHRVQTITMYVQDEHVDEDICAVAGRTDPNSGTESGMGEVCSDGYAGGVRVFSISGASINPNSIGPNDDMYLWVTMVGPGKLKLYGFHIDYDVCYALATTVGPIGAGSINVTTAANCDSDGYTPGTTVNLEASAASGWHFVTWGGDASGTSPTTSVTMESYKSVSAFFMCDGCVPRAYLPIVFKSY
jgi:hypothetical protein